MTDARVTIGTTSAITTLDEDFFEANQVIPFSSLTKSFVGGTGVHLSMWPGWCDPTASRTTDLGGTGASVRTAQTGSRMVLPPVTGSRIIGVRFKKSIWQALNGLGKVWNPRPSVWAYRYLDNGVYSAWVEGVRPDGNSGGWIIKHDLDPTHTYQLEIEPTLYTDHHGHAQVGNVPLTDYMREPEIVGNANFPTGEQTAFQELDALILSDGATYGTVSLTGTPKVFKVFADSNSHGLVLKTTGQPVVEVWDAVTETFIELDARGHHATGIRRGIEAFCTTRGFRPIIHHASYGGLFAADIPDSIYNDYASTGVYTLASPPIYRIAQRYGYWKINASGPHTKEGRVDPVGLTVDYAIVSLITNDQVVGALSSVRYGTGSPEYASFSGTAFATAAYLLGLAIHAALPTAQVIFANNHLSDLAFGGLVTTHSLFELACGPFGLNFPNAWGLYVDLRAEISTSIIPDDFLASLHLNYAQHTAVATEFETALNTLTP